ncbi:MAG: SCO family protein [Chloroflexi bacterium]|nr:SCO family protein [Chloroflexota bacterium]
MAERKQAKTSIRGYLLRRIQLGLISALLVGIAALAMAIAYGRMYPGANPQTDSFEGGAAPEFDGSIIIDPPLAMPDFTLRDQSNKSVSLVDLRDNFVLITFGYTNCPDVCPLTLNEFRSIRESLGSSSEEVAFLFISVDGERDTPEALRSYFALRELDGIIGLSGEEEAVRALGLDYGLSFEMTKPDKRGGYLVNHTAGSFLLDRNGRWIRRYQFGLPPGRIVADLEELLAA